MFVLSASSLLQPHSIMVLKKSARILSYMVFVTLSLQLIFIGHKVYACRRLNSKESMWSVIRKIFQGKTEEPVIFSRVSIVNFHHENRQVVHIELDDEFSHQELRSGHLDVEPDDLQLERVDGIGRDEDQPNPNDTLSFPSFFGSAVQSEGNDVFMCGSISQGGHDLSGFSASASTSTGRVNMSLGLSISDESHLEGGFGTSKSTDQNR
jgi:hypothetical protein